MSRKETEWQESDGEGWKEDIKNIELTAMKADEEGRQAAEEDRRNTAIDAFFATQTILEESNYRGKLGFTIWDKPGEMPSVVVLVYVYMRHQKPNQPKRRMRKELLLKITEVISGLYSPSGVTATFCLNSGCNMSRRMAQRVIEVLGKPVLNELF